MNRETTPDLKMVFRFLEEKNREKHVSSNARAKEEDTVETAHNGSQKVNALEEISVE